MTMKSIFIIVFALCSICCISSKKTGAMQKTSEPNLIILQDSARSITLQSTLSGGEWVISGGYPPNTYLATLASQIFGVNNIDNFQNIMIVYATDFSVGTLTGNGFDTNGNKVPIGVEYQLRSQLSGTYTYQISEVHTCTGAPCSCCEFIKNTNGTIQGCKCSFENDNCQWHEGPGKNVCNHSVSQQ